MAAAGDGVTAPVASSAVPLYSMNSTLQSFDSSLFDTGNSLSSALGSAAGSFRDDVSDAGSGGRRCEDGAARSPDNGIAPEHHAEKGGNRRDEDSERRTGALGARSSVSFRVDPGPLEGLLDAAYGARAVVDPFEDGELKIIEDALRCLRLRSGPQKERAEEETGGVDKLLKKVQAVRSQSEKGQTSFGGDEPDSADIERIVRAASQAALAAAKAAEAALAISNRNSEVIERLCKTLDSSQQTPASEIEGEDGEDANAAESVESPAAEIKELERQNRKTHWLLGFIVVSTIIWRFGVVKFVMKVNDTIQNPFQGVTDTFTDWTGISKRKKDDKDPGLPVPPILGDQDKKGDQKSTAFDLEDQKDDLLKFGRQLTGQEKDKKSDRKSDKKSGKKSEKTSDKNDKKREG